LLTEITNTPRHGRRDSPTDVSGSITSDHVLVRDAEPMCDCESLLGVAGLLQL
jgi:hypothetical protein